MVTYNDKILVPNSSKTDVDTIHPETNTGQVYDFGRAKWLDTVLADNENSISQIQDKVDSVKDEMEDFRSEIEGEIIDKLPKIATYNKAGIVKPDGDTITVDATGKITSIAKGYEVKKFLGTDLDALTETGLWDVSKDTVNLPSPAGGIVDVKEMANKLCVYQTFFTATTSTNSVILNCQRVGTRNSTEIPYIWFNSPNTPGVLDSGKWWVLNPRYTNDLDTNSNTSAPMTGAIKDLNGKINANRVEINSLKNSVSSGKSQIANAITQQGVATSPTAEFAVMANNIKNLSIGAPYATGKDVYNSTGGTEHIIVRGLSFKPKAVLAKRMDHYDKATFSAVYLYSYYIGGDISFRVADDGKAFSNSSTEMYNDGFKLQVDSLSARKWFWEAFGQPPAFMYP